MVLSLLHQENRYISNLITIIIHNIMTKIVMTTFENRVLNAFTAERYKHSKH